MHLALQLADLTLEAVHLLLQLADLLGGGLARIIRQQAGHLHRQQHHQHQHDHASHAVEDQPAQLAALLQRLQALGIAEGLYRAGLIVFAHVTHPAAVGLALAFIYRP